MHRPVLRRPRGRDLPLLLAIGGFVAWFVLLGPSAIGGPATYVFVSGTSMEPTLQTGDLVVVRSAEAYASGDIIAFLVPEGNPAAGGFVIHRIVGGSSTEGFTTQGDNRLDIDSWRAMSGDIVGEAWIVLPGAGPYLTWLRNPAVFASLAAGFTVFTILLGAGDGRKQSPPRMRPLRPIPVGRSRHQNPAEGE